jgi:hypothetical protein
LKWRAATDNSVAAAGAAGVRIDSISLTGGLACVPLKILSITRLTSGHIFLQGVGVPNGSYTMQAAPDLNPSGFGPITVSASGQWQYEDMDAGSFPERFYRLSYP